MTKKKLANGFETILNRGTFLSRLKPQVIFHTIEGFGTIGISLLSTAERLELIEEWKLLETDAGQQLLATLKLLPKVLTDADGKKLLTTEDLEALRQGNARLVDDLVHAALDINGMTKKSVDTLEKNSDPALSD